MPIHQVINSRVPVKIWAKELEEQAIGQLINTAALPIVFKHVAAMPDTHYGMGATVGSVVATDKAIIPAAVGVDVGCGMAAIKTDLNPSVVEANLKLIRKKLEGAIPVGFKDNPRQPKRVDQWKGWDTAPFDIKSHKNQDVKLFTKAHKQLGSLGGGKVDCLQAL